MTSCQSTPGLNETAAAANVTLLSISQIAVALVSAARRACDGNTRPAARAGDLLEVARQFVVGRHRAPILAHSRPRRLVRVPHESATSAFARICPTNRRPRLRHLLQGGQCFVDERLDEVDQVGDSFRRGDEDVERVDPATETVNRCALAR